MKKYDVVIVGAGMVGLSLATLLNKDNFSVCVIESQKINLSYDQPTARVSAIHLTSQKLLDYLGVWELLKTDATPLQKMHIWDHAQHAQLHFNSDDIQQTEMGWIVDNSAIISALRKKLSDIDFYQPVSPEKCLIEKNKIILFLNNTEKIETDLIVGADGANSWVREQMQMNMHTRSYYQQSIIAVIKTELPHDNIAYQKFLTTGPVALLPLKNKNHTALVWSADENISDELMKNSDDIFAEKLTRTLDFKLGKLKIISERASFSLIMRHASDYVSSHFALVGDAAHTIHPLAGLGVNLGLMDAACLAQILREARENKKSLGDFRVLRRYTRWRKSENTPIICAMRQLKELFAIDSNEFNYLRDFTINTIDQQLTIKKQLMQIATGKSKELPSFLQ